MIINEDIDPHIKELERYSIALFEFIVNNIDEEITYLKQLEFNCLFRVYNDQINFICDTYDIPEEQISEFSLNDDKFDKLTENQLIDPDDAVELFMEYLNSFLNSVENSLPTVAN